MKKNNFFYPVRFFIIGAIGIYQKILSFDHSPMGKTLYPHGFCRFNPTCSEYGKQCFLRFGVIKGGWLTIWRIFRCNPFSQGGNDPIPEK